MAWHICFLKLASVSAIVGVLQYTNATSEEGAFTYEGSGLAFNSPTAPLPDDYTYERAKYELWFAHMQAHIRSFALRIGLEWIDSDEPGGGSYVPMTITPEDQPSVCDMLYRFGVRCRMRRRRRGIA